VYIFLLHILKICWSFNPGDRYTFENIIDLLLENQPNFFEKELKEKEEKEKERERELNKTLNKEKYKSKKGGGSIFTTKNSGTSFLNKTNNKEIVSNSIEVVDDNAIKIDDKDTIVELDDF
jgi:hypothetical protein